MDKRRSQTETWRSKSLVMVPLSAGLALLFLALLSLAVDVVF